MERNEKLETIILERTHDPHLFLVDENNGIILESATDQTLTAHTRSWETYYTAQRSSMTIKWSS
jgi:hypothetical protein